MLIQPTLDTLNRLKLHGIALALSEQMTSSAAQQLAFEQRIAILLEREVLYRENRRLGRLLKQAQLKERGAVAAGELANGGGRFRGQLGDQSLRHKDNIGIVGNAPEPADSRQPRLPESHARF
jgi:hypothetical protein